MLSHPAGLACAAGLVTVADYANHRIQVFDRNGGFVKQWGAPPAMPGVGKGRFHYPEGLAVTPSGGLTVVSEPVENRLQVFSHRNLGKLERVNDLPWWDGLHARLHAVRLAPPPPGSKPQAAAVLASPDVHAVFLFDVSANALGPIVAAGGYGPKLGEFNGIGGVAIDPARGRLVVGDPGNRRLVTFDVPKNPERPELFGNSIRVVGAVAFEGVATPAPEGYDPKAAVPGPMARRADGRLYILDRANAAILVCDADLRFLSRLPVSPTLREFTVAADGSVYATDPAHLLVRIYGADGRERTAWNARTGKPGESLRDPWGIALDDQGFVYVADSLEDAVFKFDRDGRFVKRWGTPGPYADRLTAPRSLTFYAPDRLIVEDYGNHRAQLCNTEGEFLGNYVAGGLATPITIR
jgi:DNA-binding beta-propeller fold protein YncE